jgi:hypothetical protein
MVYPAILFNCPITTSSVMVRSDIMKGHRFRNIRCAEDIIMWCDLARKGTIIGIDEPLIHISVSEQSSAFNREKQIEGIRNLLQYVNELDDISVMTWLSALWHWACVGGKTCLRS